MKGCLVQSITPSRDGPAMLITGHDIHTRRYKAIRLVDFYPSGTSNSCTPGVRSEILIPEEFI